MGIYGLIWGLYGQCGSKAAENFVPRSSPAWGPRLSTPDGHRPVAAEAAAADDAYSSWPASLVVGRHPPRRQLLAPLGKITAPHLGLPTMAWAAAASSPSSRRPLSCHPSSSCRSRPWGRCQVPLATWRPPSRQSFSRTASGALK